MRLAGRPAGRIRDVEHRRGGSYGTKWQWRGARHRDAQECALSLDTLTFVPKELFRTRITPLSVDRMTEVCWPLALASGCRWTTIG